MIPSTDAPPPPPQCAFVSYAGCKVPLRDGLRMAADVYLPPDRLGERIPCLLTYSPYGATASRQAGLAGEWIPRGIAVVAADCRGLHNSEGEFHPWQRGFVEDAADLLAWISAQPWSNGKVAMVGGSYPGATQLACLRSGHPALAACAPSAVTLDPYSIYYDNGAQVVAFQAPWHIGIAARAPAPAGATPFAEASAKFPVGGLADRMGVDCPSWREQCEHDWRDGFWKEKADLRDLARSRAGVFYQGGWFDKLGVMTFETFETIRKTVTAGTADSPRKYSCLRVGPWGHGVNTPEGEIDYGGDAMVTADAENDFLVSILEGRAPATATNPAPMRIFVMGRNIWRFENEWPLARTVYTPLYLAGDGAANTAAGDGRLSPEAPPPGRAGADHFVFDPADPVPSNGGRDVGRGGQRDQTEIERRHDVLVYTGDVLEKDLEATGRVSAVLYVASTAPDTDFTVKLVDVFPDGRPMSVLDGIVRASFRDGVDGPPRPLTPGEHTRIEFFVDVTSYCFLKGHRVRVEISSSNFPHFAPNTNTGEPAASGDAWKIASQTIFHTPGEPSHVILPVIPGE